AQSFSHPAPPVRKVSAAHCRGARRPRIAALLDPRITRRDFLKAASLLATPTAYPCIANAHVARPAPPAYAYAYVGTYTPNGGGIYLFRMDRASGALTQLQVFDDIRNPSWLVTNPAQ